jgi:hypothetical protein
MRIFAQRKKRMSEKMKVLFPYGISNLEQLVENDFVFVDKTVFIEKLEGAQAFFTVFLRPRRFGKSLFLSVLEYYYDINRKAKFEKIFSKYYIGKNPTKHASSYRILKFDFSGIDTRTKESTYSGFVASVRISVLAFCIHNSLLNEDLRRAVEKANTSESVMDALLDLYPKSEPPIYLLIDEYDHFTNEILLRDLTEFRDSVSKNGYVRKFYETIKSATQSGVIDRFFITGVSPVTLDALTSGFNIATNLTLSEKFHDLMGFSEEEVRGLLLLILDDKSREEKVVEDMRTFYNGYKFNANAPSRLYNSDMALYFLKHFADGNRYPVPMLDENIAPDYGKLKMIFERLNWTDNRHILEEVLQTGEVTSKIVRMFDFSRSRFGQNEFVSFLFYMGNLTVLGSNEFGETVLTIPNQVIRELYWEYYADVLSEHDRLPVSPDLVSPAIRKMAGGNPEEFFGLVRDAVKQLSNRDFRKFNEKYIKLLFIAYAMQSEIFFVQSERETSAGGYVDLELSKQPRNRHLTHFEYVFEFKYLKKEEESKLEDTQAEAEKQLCFYLENDEILKSKPKLRAFTVVVVKDEMFLREML